MSTWQQVKQTLAVSDRLNEALRALNERHVALVDCHGVEGLTALVEGIEALVAATEPKGSLSECPGQGCQDQGCPAHYAG